LPPILYHKRSDMTPVIPSDFDPNAASSEDAGVFGLDVNAEKAALVYLPVPWDVTTSYGAGTARGPAAILRASRQVDLYDGDVLRPYEAGLAMLPESAAVAEQNVSARKDAEKIIAVGGDVGRDNELKAALSRVNAAGERLNDFVFAECLNQMKAGKIVGLVGGDHAAPFGAYRAAAEVFGEFALLHFDAHHDFRIAYEGFTWSHASIMYNALTRIPKIKKVVQVGIRDYCEQESDFLKNAGARAECYYDQDLKRREFSGEPWAHVTGEIISRLPENVWISLDIDGLDPKLCPNTGTPVPGGQEFYQVNWILGELARSGRKILGFDLVEVAPGLDGNEWDANVGARLLYKLSAWTLASRGLAKIRP
jgi:agmatinase